MSERKKLIEVALPLEDINVASAHEKSVRHGHPSTLHLWWARRPLATCRAVLFSSIVDDPSSRPDEFPTSEAQAVERERLFELIRRMVKWESIADTELFDEVRAEILKATDGNPPPVLDPFCGGGSIPLEAQRLGLEAHASDLNPVAVLITKALIEIPPRFANMPPVHPSATSRTSWHGAEGLAEDVRRYGAWMRDRAKERIGHLYPKVRVGGSEHTVIAWLWARTVTCPNPGCRAEMPLVRSFELSRKKGKETYVEPIVEGATVRFEIRTGKGAKPGTVSRQGATCIVCKTAVSFTHVRAEGKARGLGARLMAIVADGQRGRIYLPPSHEHEELAASAKPDWEPEGELPHNPRDFKTPNYGMTEWKHLFTPRQLTALTTFSHLVGEARAQALTDATASASTGSDTPSAAGHLDRTDPRPLRESGQGPIAYADAVSCMLGLVASRLADYGATICSWHSGRDTVRNVFARQAIPMTWDFAEPSAMSDSTGGWLSMLRWTAGAVEAASCAAAGSSVQLPADSMLSRVQPVLVSTDPPYFDNIGYADLSDFFFVWLRAGLRDVFPDLFRTVATPKAEELVATPYRFGGSKEAAETHFRSGMTDVLKRMLTAQHPDYPASIYYAYKASESDDETGRTNTGWASFLQSVVDAGFRITATVPMRSELANRMLASGTNALASSIVVVVRPRRCDAPLATRAEFLNALRAELPDAIRTLESGAIAPVDLPQALVGPGMGVFTRYRTVREASGESMPVGVALSVINQVIDQIEAEQTGEFDAYTRFAIEWYRQHGWSEGDSGAADAMARGKNTAVNALEAAGIVRAKAGKTHLVRRDELPTDWDPTTDTRLTVWEVTQHLARAMAEGEQAAAGIIRAVGGLAEAARDLTYRLHHIASAERNDSAEAQVYNVLAAAWPDLVRGALSDPHSGQAALL